VLCAVGLPGIRAVIVEMHPKVLGRVRIKRLFDTPLSDGCTLAAEHFSGQVVVF